MNKPRTRIPVCEPTPPLDDKAWAVLMSLRHKKLSPETKAALLEMKKRMVFNKDGSIAF
jgi:hypothetical protein